MIDESVFDKVLDFLELLPEDKIKNRVIDNSIPEIDDEEQQEMEQILKKNHVIKSHVQRLSIYESDLSEKFK